MASAGGLNASDQHPSQARSGLSDNAPRLDPSSNGGPNGHRWKAAHAEAQSKAEGQLSGALSRLLAIAENYPDLKANQNFLALQEELTSTENKIAFSRQFYNDSVLQYNNKMQMFPSNMVAGMTGFKAGEFFEVEAPAERAVPTVSFS